MTEHQGPSQLTARNPLVGSVDTSLRSAFSIKASKCLPDHLSEAMTLMVTGDPAAKTRGACRIPSTPTAAQMRPKPTLSTSYI